MSDFTPILIAPFAHGLNTDEEPWIIPPDGFSILDNVHIHHGVIEKRSGYMRFAQMIPVSDTVAILTVTQDFNALVTTATPHGYSDNDLIFIRDVAVMFEINNHIFIITVESATEFFINQDTSEFTGPGTGGTAQIVDSEFDRVMGIWRFIDNTNAKDNLAFNTQRAQLYNGTTMAYDLLDSAPIMSGDEFDYIVAYNWQSSNLPNRLYFTNGKAFDGTSLDGIRYYDNSGLTTTSFNDNSLGGTRTLYGCKLIFTLKQRLVLLFVYEDDNGTLNTFPQRARWCKAQSPSVWDDTTPGGGGFNDAPTGEQIVSAQLVQDILVVAFTDSMWTLRPVPNPALPFRWDRINDFRSCDGKMATVSYDRAMRALGFRGITETDGVQTQRIDKRIEDFTTNNINAASFKKVFCKRSFANERWWTLYAPKPSEEEEDEEPIATDNTAALIWDDGSSSFSTYTIPLNCLGHGNFGRDARLNDPEIADRRLVDFDEEDLFSFFWQKDQEAFLGGNIFGSVVQLEIQASDSFIGVGIDEENEIPTDMFSAAWNPFKDKGIECQLSYIDFFVDTDSNTTARVEFYKNNEEAPYRFQLMNFLPDLDTVSYILNIFVEDEFHDPPFQVTINSPNSGLKTGDVIFIYLVQGMVEVNGGPYTITVIDNDNFTLDGISGEFFSDYITDGNIVRRLYYPKNKVWKRAYGGGIGYQHRIRITTDGNNTSFRFHSLKPYFKPIGKRTIDS